MDRDSRTHAKTTPAATPLGRATTPSTVANLSTSRAPARELTVGAASGPKWGGDHSNTPPQNLHDRANVQQQTQLPGGEDWFEGVLYLDFADDAVYRTLTETLDLARERALVHRQEQCEEKKRHRKPPLYATLPGSAGQWYVQPFGGRLGDAEKGPVIRWMLKRDGVSFGLMARQHPHKTQPSAFFRFTGETMLALGSVERAWELVKTWFAELGAVIVDNRLSRVDPCVDLPGIGVDELCESIYARRVLSRVKKAKEWVEVELYRTGGMKLTGFTLGKGTQLRVYDKTEECRDLAKRAWMIQNRWGGTDQVKATRVEFQLRREFLGAKKNKPDKDGFFERPVIDTVEDYLAFRPDLIRYLTHDWVRFVEEEGFDRRQPKRAITLGLWQDIQAKFAQWAGAADRCSHQAVPRSFVSVDPLVVQAIGCLESAAASLQLPIDDALDFLGFCRDQFRSHCEDDPYLPRRIKQKHRTLCPVVSDNKAGNWLAAAFTDSTDTAPVYAVPASNVAYDEDQAPF